MTRPDGLPLVPAHDDALMPYSTRSPKDAERYRRFNELRAQTGDTMAAAALLLREANWTPAPRIHRELKCGCRTDGHMCDDHAPRFHAAAE